ncbi:MAG: cytochrome c biogenesis protein CcdA [Nocardioides sp.]
MLALVGAFVAGVLTTLAPCVLPLLPVIVGGSLTGATLTGARRALVVTAALGASIVAFTLLLRASTTLIGVDPRVWSLLAGGLLVLLGLVGLFPGLWEAASGRLALQQRSTTRLADARGREGVAGAVLTGAALGPVFSSCSPLYGYVIVTVIPARPSYGVVLLATYTLGLCLTLLAVALAGQRLVRRLGWLADAHGWFRRALGLVFVVVGLLVLTGLDRDVQAWIIEHSPLRPWELDRGFIPG